jgi:hypothetical protein
MKPLASAVSFAALLLATVSHAQDKTFTAGVLCDECTNHPASSVERAHCNGFIHGFLVGMMTAGDITKAGTPFCGGEPEVSTLVTVFQTFMRLRPDTNSLGAEVALTAAFATAFPCSKAH